MPSLMPTECRMTHGAIPNTRKSIGVPLRQSVDSHHAFTGRSVDREGADFQNPLNEEPRPASAPWAPVGRAAGAPQLLANAAGRVAGPVAAAARSGPGRP